MSLVAAVFVAAGGFMAGSLFLSGDFSSLLALGLFGCFVYLIFLLNDL